ncbi:hypothetical protein BBJ28_00004274 [Nothophytophthora sp. Chile5]|nr:hypothetical protein BBJ28_00004274 [Nothophytophthora sp. Chile5]
MASMEVQFKGQAYPLALAEGSTATVGELQEQIEHVLGVPKDAQRLFQKRRRVDCSDATRLVADACDCGAQAPPLYLVAGASAEQIEEMRHTHSAVQAEQQIRVGVLAEMPPDGKVGVDPVCVLGLNQNKGQKILLRLRTDDLLGFRKFLRYVLLASTWRHGPLPCDRERRIHDAIRHLQAHYSVESVAKAVSLLHKIVSNIISHPADAKFRSIRKANRLFDGQVARFPECLEFLLALGFEDQTEKFVLVREDPALLWIGRSKLEVLLPAVA